MSILHNLQHVRLQILQAEQRFQRPLGSVQLLAVSKTQGKEAIVQALQAGQHHFGENYVQEALEKIQSLKKFPLTWHFIGHIQSNKCKSIAENFSWVHSVCRADIAQKLHLARSANLPPLNICIQVNLTDEPNKSGLAIQELPSLVQTIRGLSRLKLRGLMLIPPVLTDTEAQYALFSELQRCMQRIILPDLNLDTLSVGMSQDFIPAIQAGSTIVRIGQAIFGKRA